VSDRLEKKVCVCVSWFQGCHHQKGGDCRSKFHDVESRLIQVVLMITKMMTKKPKRMISRLSQEQFMNQEKFDFKIQEKMNSSFKRRNQEDFTREVLKRFFKKQT